jgi:alginate O-acetyltransferase complex protein AlgI
MVFSSLSFLIFIMVFFPLFYLSGKKLKPAVLMIANLFFYMHVQTFYIIATVIWIFINYFIIFRLFSAVNSGFVNSRLKKFYFTAGLCFNILALIVFKYDYFLTDNANTILHAIKPSLSLPYVSLLIPLGISFITFKSISFLIEVYNGNYKNKIGLFNYSQYILFFPGVMAGPIDRPGKLMPQLENLNRDFASADIKKGLGFILWGLFQKAVIADRISLLISGGLNNPSNSTGGELLLFVLLYSVQIYCDFAGYSNMAIGAAKLFGIDVMQNFDRPYFAKSISEFWRKWHISLSSWLRDYLFLPLAFRYTRKFTERKFSVKNIDKYSYIIAVLVTMLIAGIWHGAGWTFIAWGLLLAFYMIFGFYTKKIRRRIFKKIGFGQNSSVKSFIQILVNFILITFAWIFFRAPGLSSALITIKKILYIPFGNISLPAGHPAVFSTEMIITIVLVLVYFTIEFLQYSGRETIKSINSMPAVLRYSFYIFAVCFILIAGYFSTIQFIYARF